MYCLNEAVLIANFLSGIKFSPRSLILLFLATQNASCVNTMPSQHITALKLGQPCDSDEPAPKRRAISSADCGSFRSLLEGYHYHELSSGSELLSDVCTDEDALDTSTSSSLSSNVVANTPNGSFDDGMSMDGVAIPSPQICYGMVSYKLPMSTIGAPEKIYSSFE